METKVISSFVNLDEKQEEDYVAIKTELFELREKTKANLIMLKDFKKAREEEIDFFHFLIDKSQDDESYNVYLEKIKKGLDSSFEKLKSVEETIEEVEKIVADQEFVIQNYFTEEITEDGRCIVNPVTIEYLKIATKIVKLG